MDTADNSLRILTSFRSSSLLPPWRCSRRQVMQATMRITPHTRQVIVIDCLAVCVAIRMRQKMGSSPFPRSLGKGHNNSIFHLSWIIWATHTSAWAPDHAPIRLLQNIMALIEGLVALLLFKPIALTLAACALLFVVGRALEASADDVEPPVIKSKIPILGNFYSLLKDQEAFFKRLEWVPTSMHLSLPW